MKGYQGRISNLILRNGERYPQLLNVYDMPDFWVTLFVTELLRPNLKQTAIENTIRHIVHLKLWEAINKRDLISEISAGIFPSDIDIISIRDHCLLNAVSLKDWYESSCKKNVRRISLGHPSSTRHLQVVSKAHASNRLTHIAAFLSFTARTILKERADFTAQIYLIDDMKKRIVAQKPKGLGKSKLASDPNSKAPAPELFEQLLQMVRVDSPNNPYKNFGVRKRNEAMLAVLDATGMRSGEALALYVEDFDSVAGTLKVVRRHDNPHDPRGKQPVVKTLEREIPIPLSLVQKLRDYILNVRSKVPGANKGPFLFVTHKRGKHQGKPISDSSFRNRILGTATAVAPEAFDEIRRHGFRHNFN